MKRNNKSSVFDANRNIHIEEIIMAEQELELLRQTLQIQQEEINLLKEQLARPTALFQLTAEQILTHFRKLKPFNGKGEYTLQEFINSVEDAGRLCNNNMQLLEYAFKIVFNEKIQGEAKQCILRLGSNLTWDSVKKELKLYFRPRRDYAELINECRNIKVSSLRELFNIVKQINFQLNELYEFDERKPDIYKPFNNDKYLVGIVLEKLDNLVRGNVERDASLIEIYNKFSELRLLDDERAIDQRYRKFKHTNKNSIRDQNGEGNSNRYNNYPRKYEFKQEKDYSRFDKNHHSQYDRNMSERSKLSSKSLSFKQSRPTVSNNYVPITTNYGSGFHRQRPEHQRYPNNKVEPMEIGNIQEEVNFLEGGPETSYR